MYRHIVGNLIRRLAILSDFSAFIPGIGWPDIGDVRQTVDLRERFSDGTLRQFRWQNIFVHPRDPTPLPMLKRLRPGVQGTKGLIERKNYWALHTEGKECSYA